MSINPRRLRDGRVVYDVRLRGPAGTQYKRSFRTKAEAADFVAEERSTMGKGTWVDPREGKVLLQAYATNWLRTRVGLRPRTVDLYEVTLRRHILPVLGQVELTSISSGLVRTWYAGLFEKGLAQSTCAKAYRLLRTILSTAVEDNVIAKNPCTIKGGGVARSAERPIATIEQVQALADAIDQRYRLAVLLATFAGLRLGELLALTWERIDLHAGTISVVEQLHERADGSYDLGPPKSDAGRRTIAVPAFVIAELAVYLEVQAEGVQEGRLFRGANGGPLRRAVLFRAWDAARKEVGVNHLHFHDLRHTGNTLAAATGASTRELMARMGHASAEAALRYQHATRDRDHAIADALEAMVAGSPVKPAPDPAEQKSSDAAESEPAESNVTPIEKARTARQERAMAQKMRHECAIVDPSSADGSAEKDPELGLQESGRRESNPRSQLGKLMFCL